MKYSHKTVNLNHPKRIGIDLDNTIVDYSLAYKVIGRQFEFETELVDRESIRNHLRLQGDDIEWQRFQSILYTEGLISAQPANGVREFIELCRISLIEVFIVSHKTIQTPKLFGARNLRQPAVEWLEEHLLVSNLVDSDHLHFCSTQSEKVCTINELGCELFVDDLLEVLMNPELSSEICKVLYVGESTKNVPDRENVVSMNFDDLRHWLELC